MKHIFKQIEKRFQQLQKPTENKKEILRLSLWIFGVYACINLLPIINKLLINLSSGLFFVLFLNFTIAFYLSIKTYFDCLAIKIALNKQMANKLIIYGMHAINQILFIGFIAINIYQSLCLIHSL